MESSSQATAFITAVWQVKGCIASWRRPLGCYGEYIEQGRGYPSALEGAQKKVGQGMVALVNVRTDYRARATTMQFAQYST